MFIYLNRPTCKKFTPNKSLLNSIWIDLSWIILRWVHGNEISTGGIEFDVLPLKHEPEVLTVLGLFNHQDLLGHHRQHLQVNPIKLVKAAPASRLSQTREELAQRVVLQTLWAVKHNTLFAHSLKGNQPLNEYIITFPIYNLQLYTFTKPVKHHLILYRYQIKAWNNFLSTSNDYLPYHTIRLFDPVTDTIRHYSPWPGLWLSQSSQSQQALLGTPRGAGVEHLLGWGNSGQWAGWWPGGGSSPDTHSRTGIWH